MTAVERKPWLPGVVFVAMAMLPLVVYHLGNRFINRHDSEKLNFGFAVDGLPGALADNVVLHAAFATSQHVHLTVVIILITMSAAVIVTACVLTVRLLERRLLSIATAIAIIMSAYVIVETLGNIADRAAEKSLISLMDAETNKVFAQMPMGSLDAKDRQVIDMVPAMDSFTVSIAAVAAVCVVVAAAGVFVSLQFGRSDTASVARLLAALRLALFGGSFILAFTVAYELSFRMWPAVLLRPDHIDAYEKLVIALVSSKGAVFSAVLLTFYLPPFLSGHFRVRHLLREQELPDADERSKWLSDNGLNISFLGGLKQLLAAAAPLIIGPAGGALVTMLEGIG